VLLNELFRLVLLLFEGICSLAGSQSTIQPLRSQVQSGLSHVSDKVRLKPSAIE
jgi:hypothetical protein